MSREEVDGIIGLFDNRRYSSFMLDDFHRSTHNTEWSHDKIIGRLSMGFHGMHFIPSRYEGCIDEILMEYLGDNHYLAYRKCNEHGMLILQPNYNKLGKSPRRLLGSSFTTRSSIHALLERQDYACFCYDGCEQRH